MVSSMWLLKESILLFDEPGTVTLIYQIGYLDSSNQVKLK